MNGIYEYIAFKNTKGVTDLVFNTVLEKRGTIAGIFDASFDELYSYGMHSVLADNIIGKLFDEKLVERELYLAERNKVTIITIENPLYPELLKHIHCPPQYLYVKGNTDALQKEAVAIIGSRKCSKQSQDYTRHLAADLAAYGFNVVSGFAYGIDIEAHIGAMSKGATTAVLGSGLLNIYPQTHIKYADKILENGCFITEFAFDDFPAPSHFPRRNRIISGLSKGTVVVEASKKSGSLITARYAMEQGREVFVIPHFPGQQNSAGNRLLREGARAIETYLDILDDFDYDINSQGIAAQKDIRNALPVFETETERQIFEELLIENLGINDICAKLDICVTDVMTAVTKLELEGYIVKTDGGRYAPYINGNDNG